MDRAAVFRVDASQVIGSGHVMRCLVLADELTQHGFCCLFICRLASGHLTDYIKRRGYAVMPIELERELDRETNGEDAQATIQRIKQWHKPQWIIVDHYQIDIEWEKRVRPFAERLLVIDDLADRRHDADVLLDQNLTAAGEQSYEGLVSTTCKRLIGPAYLLLRPSFYRERRILRGRSGQIKRLLLFFGGSDSTGETEKALEGLEMLEAWEASEGLKAFPSAHLQVDIVIGASNPNAASLLQKYKAKPQYHFHIQTEKMAELIHQADFALGAGGVAMWERCYLGLPSAVAVVASNQQESASLACRKGVIWLVGNAGQTNARVYADIVSKAMASSDALRVMGEHALALTGSSEDIFESKVVQLLTHPSYL